MYGTMNIKFKKCLDLNPTSHTHIQIPTKAQFWRVKYGADIY